MIDTIFTLGTTVLGLVGLGSGIYKKDWRKGTLITLGLNAALFLVGVLIAVSSPVPTGEEWFTGQQVLGGLICLLAIGLVGLTGFILGCIVAARGVGRWVSHRAMATI